jgi:hypothetical protein
MRQPAVQGTPDALHALLPLVPDQGQKTLETRRRQAQLPFLQMGHREGILEFLRLVQRAGAAKVMRRAPQSAP